MGHTRQPLTETEAVPVERAIDAAHVVGPSTAAAILDLFPIPCALVTQLDGRLLIEAMNGAFRLAGLGTTAEQSVLLRLAGDRIAAFLDSDHVIQRFQWQTPENVDCRHYVVTLARRASSKGQGRCLVSVVDRTSELRTANSLRREMATDSLTGLPNRTGFADVLDEAVAAEGQAHFAVLALDLNRFSRVNACMGGIVGDELLISVARRIKGALRARDTLARTGGDEFAILMRLDDGPGDALQVARRIEAALASPFRLSDFDVRLGCSIGIALGEDGGQDSEDLIRHAQFAVKRSKLSGQAEYYATDAFNQVRTEFGIETELRRAIEEEALTLSFQPICDLASGQIVSFEALARWTDSTGREVSPAEFIPVAEESGLIVPLGRWALDAAVRTLALWDKAHGGDCGVSMAVNLSAIQLQRDSVPAIVEATLARHQLAGSRLTLELTESTIVADPDRATQTMHALKALGTSLAMDDFGTGYSNLAYLQKLPIDILKIDRSFVTGMLADRDKVAIVRAILSLAQALGMKTTAEGVETRELEQTLAALGCTKGQGFFYSRPIDADAAYVFLMARNA